MFEMSPDNPQTSFYSIYLILFPRQHFLKYAFPHALNFTIMFFFLLYRGPMTVGIRNALSQSWLLR